MKKRRVIAIDACCLGRRKTGNETYIRGLLSGFEAHHDRLEDLDWRIVVLTTKAHTGPRPDFFTWVDLPLGNFVSRNFIQIPATLRALQADLYHASYWTRFWAMPCPVALMVHDLSFVSFPEGFHKHEQFIYSTLVRRCAIAAQHLLTVSEFSKSELMKHWQIPAARITVTHDGIDPVFRPPVARSEAEEEAPPYLLYVGNMHPRKNLVRLLDAFVILKTRHSIPHKLKIVGQSAWLAEEVFTSVRKLHLENAVEFTGYVDQNELVNLYGHASVTIYPSLYEGFGLPPLEAMACGSPTVTSNSTSLPEVAGDAAFLVDPRNPEDIAGGVLTILQHRGIAENLSRKGVLQASKFTWPDCAEHTIRAYRTIIETV